MVGKQDKKLINKEKENYTKITVADFAIEGNSATLKDMEECINRLIEKNKNFTEMRRVKANFENMGYYG